MLHAPAWADVLILLALPVIVLTALWLWGDDKPGNMTVHEQEDEPPDSSSEDGRRKALIAV